MRDFILNLLSNWWGIVLFVIFCVAFWLTVSSLLYRIFFKRFYDFVLSLVAIIILSPILIVLTVIGAIKMKGNPFFLQPRPGKINQKTGEEKVFKLIKFRTMTCAKDKKGNLLPDEKRLTRYGKFLRSTSLDELPELFNVLLGQMSLVGPRPLLVKDKVFMSKEVRERHSVRGGITGLAQVCGRNNITWTQKFEYDLEYIKKISLFKDVKILFLTVFKVLKRSDVDREGTVSDIDYGDWLLINNLITKEEFDKKIKEV